MAVISKPPVGGCECGMSSGKPPSGFYWKSIFETHGRAVFGCCLLSRPLLLWPDISSYIYPASYPGARQLWCVTVTSALLLHHSGAKMGLFSTTHTKMERTSAFYAQLWSRGICLVGCGCLGAISKKNTTKMPKWSVLAQNRSNASTGDRLEAGNGIFAPQLPLDTHMSKHRGR